MRLGHCTGGRRRNGARGVTLVETVVALSVFVLVLQAVAGTLRLSDYAAARGRLETRAQSLLQTAIERSLARPFDLLGPAVEEGYLQTAFSPGAPGGVRGLYPYRLSVDVEILEPSVVRVTVSLRWRPPAPGALETYDPAAPLNGYEPARSVTLIRRRER